MCTFFSVCVCVCEMRCAIVSFLVCMVSSEHSTLALLFFPSYYFLAWLWVTGNDKSLLSLVSPQRSVNGWRTITSCVCATLFQCQLAEWCEGGGGITDRHYIEWVNCPPCVQIYSSHTRSGHKQHHWLKVESVTSTWMHELRWVTVGKTYKLTCVPTHWFAVTLARCHYIMSTCSEQELGSLSTARKITFGTYFMDGAVSFLFSQRGQHAIFIFFLHTDSVMILETDTRPYLLHSVIVGCCCCFFKTDISF